MVALGVIYVINTGWRNAVESEQSMSWRPAKDCGPPGCETREGVLAIIYMSV
jgi:hypothetical protein